MIIWNATLDDALTRYWLAGTSAQAIAEALKSFNVDVTRYAVIGRAHRLKLGAHPSRNPLHPRRGAPR